MRRSSVVSNQKIFKFEKKKFGFFDLWGVANLAFLGARVLGSRTKFKNRFGDGNSIIISYQPLPHMPL